MTGEPGAAYEQPGVSSRIVLAVVLGFFAFAVLTGVGLILYDRVITAGRVAPPPTTFPAPRLQANDKEDLGRVVDTAWKRLSTYGWADREQGIIRVPIDVAMKRVAARGPAGFDPLEGPAVVPSPARGAPDRVVGTAPR